MYRDEFVSRLIQLRLLKNVSARDMSLSLGQNAGYINSIESGKAFPSMASFFYICEYFGITPEEYFNTDAEDPQKLSHILDDLRHLDKRQLDTVFMLIHELNRSR